MFMCVQVRAPWLKFFIYTGDEGLEYILPGQVFCFLIMLNVREQLLLINFVYCSFHSLQYIYVL